MVRKFNWIVPIVAIIMFIALMFTSQVTVHANPQHGFGTGQGRTDTVNVNDFHTSAWDRFSFNYQFTSGSDHRFELGRPTTFDGFVPVNVYTVNIRRDAQVALRPPSYGIFSGHIPTDPNNLLFPQPVNPNFWTASQLENPNVIPRFDTLQMGVNAEPMGNPLNIHNVGTPSVLPSTSFPGEGFLPSTSIR